MKLAIISLKGESSSKIADEAKELFKVVDRLDIRKIEVHATSKGLNVLYEGNPIEKYDCIYVRGSHRYLLLQRTLTEALNKEVYMPIQPSAFTIGHDKFLTLAELQKNKVPIPTTYLAATVEGAKKILSKVNFPIIMKLSSGTQGKGVMSADSLQSANSILDTLEVFKQPYIIEEYIETNATDIRIIVAGDKIIGAMKRKATSEEMRANIHMGAIGSNFIPSLEMEEISLKAAKAIKSDICAIDILEGLKPMVIEVNLSPGLEGITKATGKNIPKSIAEFLYEKTKKFKSSKTTKDYNDVLKEIDNGKEIITNLNIKTGKIRLPEIITKTTGFKDDDEVTISIDKGKLIVKKIND
jgi:ribosomal protein S6--L-glutamate ligase|tara:strand:- start:2094 stop:3158 length:1065 start_codon:yes stop_codon:yes gene_type:complete